MIGNKYKFGLILGRFNPLHIGHEYLINYALSRCDKLLVFVGSANKEGTIENPFSYKEREEMLKTVFKDKIIVAPLDDLGIGNVPSWGDYLINSALKYIPSVDVFFYGDEEKCHQWFSKDAGNHIEFDIISRKIIDIHGKDIRKFIIDNDEESFKIYTNKAIHSMYPQLRNKMLHIINK